MSLCVKLYSDSDELFQAPLWQSDDKITIVVCPSPAEADRVRVRLKGSSTDVITISKYISSHLSSLENPPLISRKAELLLKLSIFWKRVFPEYGYERFLQCFTLLTELRGTSLELEALQEVLEEYHPEVSQGIQMLWSSMQATELHDEHSSYALLAEAYRQTPSPLVTEQDQRIVFHGFAHLSGVQIDLLKAVALRHETIVPYRSTLFAARHSSDWISWLSTEEEQVELVGEEENLKEIPIHYFSKNRMAECLEKEVESDVEVLLGCSRPLLRDFLEIPLDAMFFKTPVDLLSEAFSLFETKIRLLFASSETDNLSTSVVLEKLEQLQAEVITKQDFRAYKALKLIQETLQEWLELATSNEIISTFDWEVLRECIHLKSPRVYQAPNLSQVKTRGRIRAFNEAGDIEAAKNVAVCISSSHASYKLGESDYSIEVASLLTALGPRRRKELDFLKAREEFREMLSRTNVSFFIEQGLLEHDLGWAEMLSGLKLVPQESKQGVKRQRQDLLNKRELAKAKQVSTYSPSRIQTYLDCPRQYYYKYIENISDKSIKQKDLEARFLGEIEHDIIAQFCEQNKQWDESNHKKICGEVFAKFLSEKNIELDSASFVSHFQEVRSYSKTGILFVYKLLASLPEASLSFEEEYKQGEFKGRVDLMIRSTMGLCVLDFKRSAASIPNKSGHESFDKLQLWNYLSHANPEARDILFWGYISLKDISSSLLYTSWDELIDIFEDVFDETPRIYRSESEQLGQRLNDYVQFESQLVSKLKQDESWRAVPKSNDVCMFCAVNTLCSRGLV